MLDLLNQMESLFLSMREDERKHRIHGNKAAGIRLGKGALDIQKIAKELRKTVIESRKENDTNQAV